MKNRLWILTVGILFVIGVCTVISANNYMQGLTLVTLTSTVPNSIRIENVVTGNLYYQETTEVEVPVGCRVQEVFVFEGDSVTVGSPLLMIAETDLHITYLQKKLESEKLLSLEENGGTEGELASWQRKIVEEELVFLERLLAGGGIVYAEFDGDVIRQGYEKGDITGKESRLELGMTERGCYLEWMVPSNLYREYTSGYATLQDEKEKISWEAPVYKDGAYVFTIPFPKMTECDHGKPVEIQLIFVSEEHKAMLPKSCIRYYEDGSPYVYQVLTRSRNFGKESYVRKVGVTIEDKDSVNVVVKAELANVVLQSAEELSDMRAVAIIEE